MLSYYFGVSHRGLTKLWISRGLGKCCLFEGNVTRLLRRKRLRDSLRQQGRRFAPLFFGPTKQLAEKVTKDDKTIPQGLKPESFCSSYGTAEAVPLQNSAFFRKL
jgi:hypothetical protein